MTYVLHIIFEKDEAARIGGLGELHLKKGVYFYVGSAQAGLEARIRRHLSRKKNIFWHIDYLLSLGQAKIKNVWINDKAMECRTARKLQERKHDSVDRFGSSDCRCKSHLFFVKKNIGEVQNFLRREGFKNADKSSFR